MTSACDEEYSCMVIQETSIQFSEWEDAAFYMANLDIMAGLSPVLFLILLFVH